MHILNIEYKNWKDLQKKLKDHYEGAVGRTIEEEIKQAVEAELAKVSHIEVNPEPVKEESKVEPVKGEPVMAEPVEPVTESAPEVIPDKEDPVANPTVMDIIEENKVTEEVPVDKPVEEVAPAVDEEKPAEEAQEAEPTKEEETKPVKLLLTERDALLKKATTWLLNGGSEPDKERAVLLAAYIKDKGAQKLSMLSDADLVEFSNNVLEA